MAWRAEVRDASFSDAQCAALMHGENEWTAGVSPLENAVQWKAMVDAGVEREERLWRTYTLLTDLEAVFRALKSELGLRPIHHRTPRRAEGHLFITVIAYQLVQVIRRRLAERADGPIRCTSWTTLKRILGGRQRVTTTFKRADGRTVHVRKATRAEPQQQAILDALGITSSTGGTQ